MKVRVSDEEFKVIVQQSLSVAQVISRLGLVPAGGNYKTVQHRMRQLGTDTSHFTGSAWNVGARYQRFGKVRPLAEILVADLPYGFTHGLRNRLLKEKVKSHKCESCGLSQWLDKVIPLELHHINGINNDHRIENLQLLCPNCHALTPSYRGKNQKARVV